MKSLDDIMRDLEGQGFILRGGKSQDKHYRRLFTRNEGEHSLAVVEVSYVDFEDAEEEPELEPEEREQEETPIERGEGLLDSSLARSIFDMRSADERMFVYQQLCSCYPDEIVSLITTGNMEVPLWLQKKVLERRR